MPFGDALTKAGRLREIERMFIRRPSRGRTVREIAEHLEIPERTVRKYLNELAGPGGLPIYRDEGNRWRLMEGARLRMTPVRFELEEATALYVAARRTARHSRGPAPALRGAGVGNPVMSSPLLAGVHCTGSTETFQNIQNMWKTIGSSIASYRTYPRIVGEPGGKDFIFAQPSADPVAVATALVRGAFEYQGQKCSAASRSHIPKSLWPAVSGNLLSLVGEIRMGDPMDFRNFMTALINAGAFETITSYIRYANESTDPEVLSGGGSDSTKGHFIEPTVVLATDPQHPPKEEMRRRLLPPASG